MKKAYIMCGASGSGKTTYASEHIEGPLPTGTAVGIYSADFYFEDQATGEYKWNREGLSKAHQGCLREFLQDLSRGISEVLIVDNTNCSPVEIAPYAQAALAFGCELEIIILQVSAETALKRNKHNVPIGTIKRQIHKLTHYMTKLPDSWPHRFVSTEEALPCSEEEVAGL